MMAIFRGLVVAAALTVIGGAAAADQDDPRLDELFTALEAADGPVEAREIEARIWNVWLESGDERIDRLMASGIAAMGARQFDEALVAFNAVVELAPDFAEGWNKRATLYYLMGDYPASIADIGRTLDLEPRHFGALSGLSMIHLDQGEGRKALLALERAVEIHPFMPNAKARIRALRNEYGQPI